MTALAFCTLVSVGVWGASPLQVKFGQPEFTIFPGIGTHWGDLPTVLIGKVQVTNHGLCPIWYRKVSPGDFAIGNLPSTAETVANSELQMDWQILESGQSVELREYGIKYSDKISILFQDWTGRQSIITYDEIEMGPIWEQRDSLPEEQPRRNAEFKQDWQ